MDDIRELLPHYLVALVLVFASTAAIRLAFGRINIALEFLLVLLVIAVYVVVIRRLGYAPSQWQ